MSHASSETRPDRRRAQTGEAVVDRHHFVSLTNGRYTTRLNAAGCGYSSWGGIAVTRWQGDPLCEESGVHIYLRDLEDQAVWSAGFQPSCAVPEEYVFRGAGSRAEIGRVDNRLACQLLVCVARQGDCELRQCRLTNQGKRTRHIELTSYLEWVLTSREADTSHPAFSKLFVETFYDAERQTIFARRRPRGVDEPPAWGFHALVLDDNTRCRREVEFETSRVAFIGRGRALRRPRALDEGVRLTGRSGSVLDPIASLRVAIELRPGSTHEVAFLLGASASRDEAADLLSALGHMPTVSTLIDGAATWGDTFNGLPDKPVQDSGLPGPCDVRHAAHEIRPASGKFGPVVAAVQPVDRPAWQPAGEAHAAPEPLQFDNGYGGFSADGREYIVRLTPDANGNLRRPPMPWVNVIANEAAGFIVSEAGGGYMWAGNSRLNRLTAWHNDPVCDPHAEAVWIRDEDSHEYWSVTSGPSPAPTEYVVRHGFGYSTFRHRHDELSGDATMFVARNDPVKITRVRLQNHGTRPRRLTLFSFAHWALGGLAAETYRDVETMYDSRQAAILATNRQRETYGGHTAFSAIAAGSPGDWGATTYTCDRAAFLGELADMSAPAALVADRALDGRSGKGLDPCAAWRVPVELPPGGNCEVAFLLGEAAHVSQVDQLLDRYRTNGRVEQAFREVQTFWNDIVSSLQIETPNPEIDLLVNGWLSYQNLSCRIWARSAYYQPGGAYGFRDQLQDAAALVLLRPDLTRDQIIRHASQQFPEGDVLHWWHPDTRYGLRTRFSDDLLWLPFLTAHYVNTTGDETVWDEVTPFVDGPPIPAGHPELYMCPVESGLTATVYEHCCRALDRGLTVGPHGLPLIGCGDWNDGFSRVGRQSRGESVWLGFFIHFALSHILPACRQRGDADRTARYEEYRSRVAAALNGPGWDGQWYRRAFYDSGDPIGSAASDECQIDAIAQAWAVISGVAPPDRARCALAAVEQRLVCREAGLIRLLTPPFDCTPHDPGYIKGYLRGIRENGGQYTHGVLWVVRALAELGRGSAAVEMLTMLSPVSHTASTAQADVYQTEPYVVAADVYGEPPHLGRGGWTWYTGSAGWMFRIAVESIFGLTIDRGRTLVIRPAISSSWPRCRLTYRLPNDTTTFDIVIENPHGRESGVSQAMLDGNELDITNGVARVPVVRDGGRHQVAIWL